MRVGIIGGDRRQVYLARALGREGFEVAAAGLGLPGEPTLEEALAQSGRVVLPLPATRDGRTLNAPLAGAPIPLDDGFAARFTGKDVYAGGAAALAASSPRWALARLRDYYAREELLTGNAALTAEAALGLAITRAPGTLAGARCLVAGFGRIGGALCPSLRALGARVSCAARRPEAFAALRAMGCEPLGFSDLARPFDLIFNTVPAPVISEAVLSRQPPWALLMELASAPGGFDRPAAQRLGLPILDAPGLPGRLSPQAAGELLKETLILMFKEEATL